MSTNIETMTIRCDNDCQMSGCPGHHYTLTYQSTSDYFTINDEGFEWGADLNKMEALLEMLFKMSYYRVEVSGILSRAKENAAKAREEVSDLVVKSPEATDE